MLGAERPRARADRQRLRFYDGYDLVASAEARARGGVDQAPLGLGARSRIQRVHHDPDRVWDPVINFQWISRNVTRLHEPVPLQKPLLYKVHGFCVAGGTDIALLLGPARHRGPGEDATRRLGCGACQRPRSGPGESGRQRAKRLLLTGDSISGADAAEWGLAAEAAPADRLEERFEALLARVARVPVSQFVMHKLLVNQAVCAQGLHATQLLGHLLRRRRSPHP